MSELPELPPAPRRHHAPPPDGLEAAMREGRRRRNRAAATLAGAAAVVLLAVPAAGLLPDRGSDRLVPADDGPTVTSTPTPPAGPRAPAAFREDTDESAAGGQDCAPGADGGDVVCRYTGGTADGAVLARDDAVVLVLGYCLPRDASADRVLSFPSGQEKDVVVTSGEDELYRFSETVRYVEGAHERELRRGRCVEWTGEWQLTTTQGQPVPPGEHTVVLEVRGSSADPLLPDAVSTTVTVR